MFVISEDGQPPCAGYSVTVDLTPEQASALSGVKVFFPLAQHFGND